MRSVIIRADSSSTIGTGHIMRDLVLAKQFKNRKVVFATRNLPGNINHKIKEAGYEIASLESNNISELTAVAKRYDADTVVLDRYGIDYTEERKLKEKTNATIFVLDDTYEKHYCDILLNHNIYADPNRYKGLVPPHCELRCGSKFTLLRDEFIEAKKKKNLYSSSITHHGNLQVFIAMGGADHSNKNIEILKALEKFENIHAHIVTTTANRNINALRIYVVDKKNVTLHINTDKIANLMASSNFAIVTPSVTMNEVIFMGLPFVAIQTADNQQEMSRYLKARGYPLLETFDDMQLQQEIEKMVDFLHIKLVNFINLSDEEKRMILAWRNHPKIRKWMFNKEPITLEKHLTYIDSLPNRNDRLYFLVKHQNIGIGIIDFTEIDQTEKKAHFGLYVAPSIKGYGRLLMKLVITYGFHTLNLKTLVAEVYKENERAYTLYKKFGFCEVEHINVKNQVLLRMELHK